MREHTSFSSLKLLDSSPSHYRMYKDNLLDKESTRVMDLGTAIHCYLLENEKFEDACAFSEFAAPEGKYAKAIEYLVETMDMYSDYSYRIDNPWFMLAIEYADLKGRPDTIIKKLEEDPYPQYFDHLVSNKGKLVLGNKEYEAIMQVSKAVQNHKAAANLLDDSRSEVFTELQIVSEDPRWPFNIKGLVDIVKVDHENKKVHIADLKTTNYSAHSFESTILNRKYHAQVSLYASLVRDYLQLPDYSYHCYIIAAQTQLPWSVEVYEIGGLALSEAKAYLKDKLETLKWHYDNDSWDYPKSYHETDGVIYTNLGYEVDKNSGLSSTSTRQE